MLAFNVNARSRLLHLMQFQPGRQSSLPSQVIARVIANLILSWLVVQVESRGLFL